MQFKNSLLYIRFLKIFVVGFLLGVMFGSCNSIAQDVKTYIPKQAYQYFPLIKEECKTYLPTLKECYYFGPLIEHESCVYLTAPKCWNSHSELKTNREQGVGLGQVTRTFDKVTGAVKMDVLQDLRTRYRKELSELTWDNVKERPDLQIRAIVLLTKSNYLRLADVPDSLERLRFTDGSYNAGYGRINKRRTICGLQKDCDPNKWYGNVENICTTGTAILYGNRTACDILEHHVDDTLRIRLPKYQKAFEQ